MLRTKLFKAFALLVVIFGALSGFVGIRIINQRVIEEAQTRVTLDLSSAWAVYHSKIREIETVVRIAASKQIVADSALHDAWANPELHTRLEKMRLAFGLDFLGIVSPQGTVVARMTAPGNVGDSKATDPAVAAALKGDTASGVVILSAREIEREGEGLAERALLELEDTPHSRPRYAKIETRGMVMVSATPIAEHNQVLGVIYGGVLVNRNFALIDTIHDVVFRNEMYRGTPVGTATIFLHDSRIATTVRRANGNRALGTRVSKEVADAVLDNGRPWVGDAFVLQDWYLTAYDPLRDLRGDIVGMLYVGILKRPFIEYGRGVMVRFTLLSMGVLLLALILAFVIAGRLAAPIHRLVAASNRMALGETPAPVPVETGCNETRDLTEAFNEMVHRLAERESSLKALNRSYMETVGFVAHELKSPLATMMNYTYLMREQKLGPLSDRQARAINVIHGNVNRLAEMVRHYLNLSRIESGQFHPVPETFAVREEVLDPLLETLQADIEAKDMRLECSIPPDLLIHADRNMTREVFENLVDNAVKYGRQGGGVTLSGRPVDGFIEFSVRNDGEGIPADRMGRLFQKFSRLGGEEAAGRKGTGLGLFITRQIVEGHGGAIRAESEPGAWAAFVFTLPRPPAASPAKPESTKEI